MNLAVDYGNSRIKVGLFKQSALVQQFSFQEESEFHHWLSENSFDNVIASSVTQSLITFFDKVVSKGKKIELGTSIPIPVSIKYRTPQTLGVDRIAAACGALEIMPKQDCLVIDMGTCINYEFIDATATYHGGAISLGVKMRFDAMHTFTTRLPLTKSNDNPPLIGGTTEECLQSGVMNGVLAEIEGIMSRYKEKYPNLAVILCGGDAAFFENRLKQPIFVAPNLVLSGLNKILLHNVNL